VLDYIYFAIYIPILLFNNTTGIPHVKKGMPPNVNIKWEMKFRHLILF